jgi:hypothetical protein
VPYRGSNIIRPVGNGDVGSHIFNYGINLTGIFMFYLSLRYFLMLSQLMNNRPIKVRHVGERFWISFESLGGVMADKLPSRILQDTDLLVIRLL